MPEGTRLSSTENAPGDGCSHVPDIRSGPRGIVCGMSDERAQERTQLLGPDGADDEQGVGETAGHFYDEANTYQRTTTVIDRFADGSQELFKHEAVTMLPPCQSGCGCRASSLDQESCGFDPKSGLCNGMMT